MLRYYIPKEWSYRNYLEVAHLIYDAAKPVSKQRLECANRYLERARVAEENYRRLRNTLSYSETHS